MTLLALGLLAIVRWEGYAVFFAGLVAIGLAGILIDSVIHAYIGDRVPYERRGRVIAIVESGWSFAFLIGIPLVGIVIALFNWQAPFGMLGLASLVAALVLWKIMPASQQRPLELQRMLQGFRIFFPTRQHCWVYYSAC